jgi:hypothetical protein
MPWQMSLGLLSQNLPRILSKPTFHYRFHKNHVVGPYPEPYKSRLHNVIHLFKIHFNTLPLIWRNSRRSYSYFPTKTLFIFLPHACHTSFYLYSVYYYLLNNSLFSNLLSRSRLYSWYALLDELRKLHFRRQCKQKPYGSNTVHCRSKRSHLEPHECRVQAKLWYPCHRPHNLAV